MSAESYFKGISIFEEGSRKLKKGKKEERILAGNHKIFAHLKGCPRAVLLTGDKERKS